MTSPLDMSKDPDRFDATKAYAPPTAPPVPPVGPLDPSLDPDRYDPAQDRPRVTTRTDGKTLTDLIGKSGAQEEERDSYLWVAGLFMVFAFLGLVALLFANLSPRS